MEKAMSQDMDTESIQEMPTDIDEIEKEKAIESIVLETSTEDEYMQNFEDSDIVMEVDSSTNVTNSLYDADESPKSTDIENGNESVEIKEKDIDSLDGEHSTSIEKDPIAETQSELQQTGNQITAVKPIASSTVPTSSNKIVYVKFVPKISTQTIVTTATPQSPPKAISLTTLKGKHKKPIEKTEVNKVSPTKIAVNEPTTSNSSGASRPPIGHTVNLLNNNRILIKSVKNNQANSANASITTASPTKFPTNDEPVNRIETHQDTHDVKQKNHKPNEITLESALNVKPTEEVNQTDEQDVKCVTESNNENLGDIIRELEMEKKQLLKELRTDEQDLNCVTGSNNGNIATRELEIKKEQLFIELQTDDITADSKQSNDTIEIDDKNLLSAQKIKREFEQLQKTVNESKVLSEFVIQHNKRIRRPTKSGKKHKCNKSLPDINCVIDDNMPVHLNRSVSPSSSSVRSASKESDRSIASSHHTGTGKRNTRSMNTDFSAKQKKFLKGIQQVTRGTDDETDNNSGVDDDDDDLDYYTKQQSSITERRKSIAANKQSFVQTEAKTGWDKYCWRCHQHDTNIICSSCIRTYHANCLKIKVPSPAEMAKWQCPECIEIRTAEKENKKKKFDVKHFNKLLKYAMNRILQDPNLQQFQFPVNKTQNPGYNDIIVNPINLSKIENNIDNLVYTNSEAFLSDIKWILHNCTIYFSDNYKVTRAAKSLQKVSKQEVGDIETCPECYLNANTMTDNWFTETCARPHLILWAKLKGFPYWPAKAMSINSTLVDVRFFGEHDRANIPAKDCYLYSREDPNPPTNKYKRNTIADCVKEVDVYVDNIMAKYGAFKYAVLKTPFNPQLADQHLLDMIPDLRTVRNRRRSSTARSDLTLKIVKTADNNLSVVKKDQTAKELPQIKRTVDITGEGTVSRTPTPPSAVLARRKTSDTRIKRTKSTNRNSDGKLATLDPKSYQVLRRKSMAVDKLDPKRVSAIHSKLDLNSTIELSDVSFVRYNPKSTNEKIETDLIAHNVVVKKKTAAKKRKLSLDQVKSSDAIETPEKNQKLDDARPTTSAQVEIPEDNFQGNILSSVGLIKKTSAPNQSPDKQKNSNASSKMGQNKNSTCDTDDRSEGAARTRIDAIRRPTNKEDTTPLVLVPFVEVKKEPETENNASNSGRQTPSQTPISLISSSENTPAKDYMNIDESLSNIKTETSSDDDSLMIIDDELPNNSSTSVKKSVAIDELLDNIRNRGAISVKDINKMTLQSQQNARKTFPRGSSVPSASILKPRINPAHNKPALMNQTNMVCIPLDGNIRLDLNYNSSQPPPLSVVGSTNSVSLLTQNQSINSTATITSTSNLTNGPPPLSIPTIPTVVNVSQPSLLNPISMSTISNGLLTNEIASTVTDQIIRRNPPQLASRPAAPLRSDGGSVFPSEAGSVCKTLMENAHKMTDFFRSVIEDTLCDLASMSNPEAKMRIMELEMEKLKNVHAKELADVKVEMAEARANTDRLLTEMKKSIEKERARIINDTRRQCELERIRSVEEAKKKQWCANCLKEAQFYCCWNTSYCNHFCQRKHWEQHMSHCAQVDSAQTALNSRRSNARSATKLEVRQQMQNPQKSQAPVQKDNLNAIGQRLNARALSNIGVPALRNILPKHAMTSLNQRHSNQGSQPQAKQTPNQQCIILSRSVPNWTGSSSSSKSTSLLHSNAFFMPSSSQPYATITNVQSGSSAGVSLLNSSHAQGQKSNATETIIIP